MSDDDNKTTTNGDGYYKEDLKVDVGSFSLDMLDDADSSEDEKKKKEEDKE